MQVLLILFLSKLGNTIQSRVMKLAQKVVCVKTFKMICHRLTLPEGQGHRVSLTFGKMSIFDVFPQYLLRYFYQSDETWPKGSL